jgi:anaphase-promoting complex subunit 4
MFFRILFHTSQTYFLSANELFAFQGLQAKLTRKLVVPEPIKNWSSLPSNPRLASIQPSGDDTSSQAQDESLGERTASATSILVVSDSRRHTYSFLDGGFCLGAVSSGHQTHSVHILPNTHVLLTNQECFGSADSHCVTLIPAKSPLPLINLSTGRQLAELSSSLRELLWYMTRVVAGMQEAWFGVDGRPGARDISPKWLKALEERQRKHVSKCHMGSPTL